MRMTSTGLPRVGPTVARPTLSGTEKVGEELTCDPGEWAGYRCVLTYQWQQDGIDIANSDDSIYTPDPGDAGHFIRCVVIGTNGFSTKSKATDATGAIAP